jgi:hypothetical protein
VRRDDRRIKKAYAGAGIRWMVKVSPKEERDIDREILFHVVQDPWFV